VAPQAGSRGGAVVRSPRADPPRRESLSRGKHQGGPELRPDRVNVRRAPISLAGSTFDSVADLRYQELPLPVRPSRGSSRRIGPAPPGCLGSACPVGKGRGSSQQSRAESDGPLIPCRPPLQPPRSRSPAAGLPGGHWPARAPLQALLRMKSRLGVKPSWQLRKQRPLNAGASSPVDSW